MAEPYLCRWCKEPLVRKRGSWFELLLDFQLLRPYRCPHCYARYYLPAIFCPRRKEEADRGRAEGAARRALRSFSGRLAQWQASLRAAEPWTWRFPARLREAVPAAAFVLSFGACAAVLARLVPESLALLIGLFLGGYCFLMFSFQSLRSRQRAADRLLRRARAIVRREFAVPRCPRCQGNRLALTGCSRDGRSIEYTCSCCGEKRVAAGMTPRSQRLAPICRQLAQMHIELQFTATAPRPAAASDPHARADAR